MALPKFKTVGALALALMLASAPARPAHAQWVVIDPANLAQSITQVSHMVEQLRNQVSQIEQAAAMLRQNPLQLSPELTRSIGEARALFTRVEGLAFEAEALGEDLRTLYPETWEEYDLADVLGRSDRWLDESRASIRRAMKPKRAPPHRLKVRKARSTAPCARHRTLKDKPAPSRPAIN